MIAVQVGQEMQSTSSADIHMAARAVGSLDSVLPSPVMRLSGASGNRDLSMSLGPALSLIHVTSISSVFIVFTPSMSELLLPQDEMTAAEAMAAMAQMKFFLRTVV